MSTSIDAEEEARLQAKPRYVRIDREQMFLAPVDVEALIPPGHRARAVWELAGKLDFSEWESGIEAREGSAGRPCFSPQLLASIWLYGYSIRIASARALSRMTAWEPGLRWLTGCMEINAHTLSDFRVDDKKRLDELFTSLVAVLRREGLIDLKIVTQDGTKVKARAGKQSMHRRGTIEKELEEARRHIEELDRQACADEAQDERRVAAQKRAARERVQRLENALQEMQKREEEKPASQRDQIRISSSEPEAGKMKHADGSWAPSHNVQVMTDSREKVIVGVSVSGDGNDKQQLIPEVEALVERMGDKPGCVLADGGYVSRENVEAMAQQGIELVAPVQQSTAREAGALAANGMDPEFGRSVFVWDEQRRIFLCPAGQLMEKVKTRKHHGQLCEVYSARAEQCAACEKAPRCCGHLKPAMPRQIERVLEGPAMQAFLERMEKPEKQELYKKRSAVAETPHMRWKGNWNWRRFSVRGLQKAAMEALWLAMAYNTQVWSRVIWRPRIQALSA
jgi:transposase